MNRLIDIYRVLISGEKLLLNLVHGPLLKVKECVWLAIKGI